MGSPVTIRRLQLIPHLALRDQGETLFRNRGSRDIPAQALQLAPLIGPGETEYANRDNLLPQPHSFFIIKSYS